MGKLRENLGLMLVLLLAVGLRFSYLGELPVALNWDEVSHGYNAYSILKTGKDEWGKSWPLIFRAYGDYKLPVYIYLTALVEAVVGLSAWAMRLPSAVAGVGLVGAVYWLGRKLTKDKRVGILAGVIVALSPWTLFLSRVAVEANVGLLCWLLGIGAFLAGVEGKRVRGGWLAAASIFWGLSVFSYNSFRVVTPLTIVVLGGFYFAQLKRRGWGWKGVVVGGITIAWFVGMVVQMVGGEGRARYRWVSLINEGAVSRIIEARGGSRLPVWLARGVHNRPVYFVEQATLGYLKHFSPDFLFFSGGSHYQFNIPGEGLLYPIEVVGVVAGIWVLGRRRKREDRVILGLLLLAPVAAAVTADVPHTLRSLPAGPVLMLIGAVGWVGLFDEVGRRWGSSLKMGGWVVYGLAVFLFFERWATVYATGYATDYSWAWQYGYKEAVNWAKENYGAYDKIYVTKKYGEPHEFFLFFWPWGPASFREDENLVRYFRSDWYWVDGWDKFHFVNDWEIGEKVRCGEEKCVLVTSPGNRPGEVGWEKVGEIKFLSGEVAFEMLKHD